MKFVCEIEGTHYLLSPSRLEILISALSNAEMLTDIDVGKGKGTHGYAEQYIYGVKETTLQKNLRLSVMDDEAYEAAKFIAKQHEGKKA